MEYLLTDINNGKTNATLAAAGRACASSPPPFSHSPPLHNLPVFWYTHRSSPPHKLAMNPRVFCWNFGRRYWAGQDAVLLSLLSGGPVNSWGSGRPPRQHRGAVKHWTERLTSGPDKQLSHRSPRWKKQRDITGEETNGTGGRAETRNVNAWGEKSVWCCSHGYLQFSVVIPLTFYRIYKKPSLYCPLLLLSTARQGVASSKLC